MTKNNPQAIKDVSKLGNGLFRVAGLFKGKARVCQVKVDGNNAWFYPVNPILDLVLEDVAGLTHRLSTGEISIMCIERFE